MAGWIAALGTSERSMRLPSVLASAACGALLFTFVRRFYGREAAAYAALLFLVCEPQMHYAREARAYALVGALSVASFYAYLALVERPSWGAAAVLGAVNAAAMYTHYTIALALVAQAVCLPLLARRDRRARRLYVASQLIALAAFAPFVAPLVRNLPDVETSWLPPPDGRMLREVALELVGSKAALVFGAVVAAAWPALRTWRERPGEDGAATDGGRFALALAWAAVPIALAFPISQRIPIFYARYLLFASLGWIVLVSAATASLPVPARWRIAGALAVALFTANGIADAPARGPDWRGAVEIARPAGGAGTAIVVLPEVGCIPLAYYAAPDALSALFADDGTYAPDALARSLAARGIACGDGDAADRAIARAPDRIAVVVSGASADEESRARSRLAAHGYAGARTERLVGVTIHLLERARAGALRETPPS